MNEMWKEYHCYGLTYKVSRDGRVLGKRGELKQRLDRDGYPNVTMGLEKRVSKKVHRLVAELFVPNPQNKSEVNHIDCDRTNCKASNLEWVTRQENVSHSHKVGNYVGRKIGTDNGRSRVDEFDVIAIRTLHELGMSAYRIAQIYNIGWQTVNHIIKRNTWKYV